MSLREMLKKLKIVPVCVFNEVDAALKTSELLLKNGVNVIEITLRTKEAFDCLGAIKKEFSGMITGAGSVFRIDDIKRAFDLGASFAVSPCYDDEVSDYSYDNSIPYIPGVATPSELFHAQKKHDVIKLFPAQSLGGVDYINSMVAPFRLFDFDIVPTGGIDNRNFLDYLGADKVTACGLSYPVNEKIIKEGKFDILEQRIKEIYDPLR